MAENARLKRPQQSDGHAFGATGLQTLQLEADKKSLIYVPKSYKGVSPIPLLVYLHGSGGRAEDAAVIAPVIADLFKFIIIAPSSNQYTWDIIAHRNYGPDVKLLQECLDFAAKNYNINWDYVCLSGFSDGASYALSLGITNGDLFSHIMALSPGYYAPAKFIGEPKIFISHGNNDKVLPIDRCSRLIYPELLRRGFEVTYKEFAGGHILRPDILNTAMRWFLAGSNRQPQSRPVSTE